MQDYLHWKNNSYIDDIEIINFIVIHTKYANAIEYVYSHGVSADIRIEVKLNYILKINK